MQRHVTQMSRSGTRLVDTLELCLFVLDRLSITESHNDVKIITSTVMNNEIKKEESRMNSPGGGVFEK